MSEFTKEVKIALVMKGMSQQKLTELVAEKIGIKPDARYINHVILGKKKSAPVEGAIKEILEIGGE